MIRYYKIGEPIETGSTVMSVPPEEKQLPGWQYDFDRKQISRSLKSDSIVYGLGETVRGMNKKGWLYVSNNTDDPVHTEGKHSLYASQNFILYAMEACTTGLLHKRFVFPVSFEEDDQVDQGSEKP